MDNQKEIVSLKRKIEDIIIALFCTGVTVCVASVLLFVYRPNQNALGALGSVCMDVISIAVLLILVVGHSFEKAEISRTTRLFLGLMLASILGLFLDFLTWSSDGGLSFGEWNYVFVVSSLCMGSVLGAVFVLYLGNYLEDMYGLNNSLKVAQICAVFNLISFVIALVLASTRQAFNFVDGHYETGAMYDLVTVIPVLTLVVMTIYAIRYVKVIGLHDVAAVAGYIMLMISGALIEAVYSIGTTYVSVAVADVPICVMLQNRLIGRVKQQKQVLTERIASQYEILASMAGIYAYVNYIDLDNMTEKRFDLMDNKDMKIKEENDNHTTLNTILMEGIKEEFKENFWEYTDLSTLENRMKGEKIISAEFCHEHEGWLRAGYIRIGDSVDDSLKRVIYTIRNIDEEKKNVEKWIRKSKTDELTGFFNRHAYEDEIALLKANDNNENLIYVSIDINGLKVTNDTLGHEAGDELIVGASECMKQCFGAYGNLYRTGGDEFVALIYADLEQLEIIKKDIAEVTGNWSGRLVKRLAISCGYVAWEEDKTLTMQQMAVLADKRMYKEKRSYYQEKGIDRRGQRDAHVALCALYTKILKINATEDTYQIINMKDNEKSIEKGFDTSISKWLSEFGNRGLVHPDDLDEYMKKTNLDYMRQYFRNSSEPLCVIYRRKYDDLYRKVMMEVIPANDYSDEIQNLFMYVKDIEV